jgi:hypothetical protein
VLAVTSASKIPSQLNQMKSLSLRYGLILFLLIIDSLDSAAVPKGGVGSGGRGVKGNADVSHTWGNYIRI